MYTALPVQSFSALTFPLRPPSLSPKEAFFKGHIKFFSLLSLPLPVFFPRRLFLGWHIFLKSRGQPLVYFLTGIDSQLSSFFLSSVRKYMVCRLLIDFRPFPFRCFESWVLHYKDTRRRRQALLLGGQTWNSIGSPVTFFCTHKRWIRGSKLSAC